MANTIRTFVAVEISSEIRSKAGQLIQRLQATSAKVKWVDPKNLHLTMQFLGDVETLEIPAICQKVAAAADAVPPFDMEAFGAGAFPNVKRPRTVWLGVRKGCEELIALHDQLQRQLATLGFRPEHRKFRPHLTLGRVRGAGAGIDQLGELIDRHQDFVGGASDVSELVVFSSTLNRQGPTYEPLSYAPLAGG